MSLNIQYKVEYIGGTYGSPNDYGITYQHDGSSAVVPPQPPMLLFFCRNLEEAEEMCHQLNRMKPMLDPSLPGVVS